MSAREEGEEFVCNGHKIWTTHAHVANWIFCLVRTSREKIPQLGITFLLIDMTTPGVEVKPIVSLSGEHIQNEVFFTDVRVPKKNVVGQIGDGWTVAKYLMQFERGGGVSAPGLRVRMQRIREMAQAEGISDEDFAVRLANAAVEIETLESVELRVMSKLSRGQAPGAESSMLKMVATELSQRLTELALEAVGIYALPYQPFAVSAGGPSPDYRPPTNQHPVGPEYSWTVAAKYLNDRAGTIYAGTSEVQRNILSKAVLGL
jgi:alkylation response protein AidB-like acyl-CoA dehydrogenase